MTIARLRALVALAFLCLALRPLGALGAQGTALVAPSDPAYRDIERLVELGALDDVILGQRPYSLREFARIIRAARERFDDVGEGRKVGAIDARERAAGGIIERLEGRFDTELHEAERQLVVSPVDAASMNFISTDAVHRGFPGTFGPGADASIEPLTYRRLGRRAPPGSTLALEVQQRVEVSSWLALRARERVEYRIPNDTTLSRHDGELLLASMRVRYANLALTVGREQLAWAQREGLGLFLASDAPALDQVSLAGDEPFRLPGFLDRLGPTQGTIFLADIGASAVRSHSRLLGYKLSVQPDPSFEIGGSFLNHFGGEGAPSASTGSRIVDFLPFVDIFRKHNYLDSSRALDVESDKLLGVDARWRIARLGGLQLVGEVLIDDFDVHQIQRLLTGYGSSNLSIVLPQLGSPAWALELTARHMGILTYTHGQLTNGVATRGRLLGDELGPNAKAFGVELTWRPFPAVRVATEGRAAIYSSADYASEYADSAQTDYVVRKVAARPDELRDRFRATVEFQSDEGLALVVRGGGERVRNLNFQGDRRNEYLLDVALRLRM
jgi:hypothetical protein